MKKKKIYFVIAVVCFIVFVITFLLSDKRLDLESNEVSTLYKYLGEVDVYHCGGLVVYSDEAVIKKDISNENALCLAYYNIDNNNISEDTAKSIGTNDNDIKICKVGEKTTLATNNDEDFCKYTIIKKKDLNESFKKIYGEEIKDYSKFYISSSNACFLEGDTYYCGTAEAFTYSLVPQATIYRLLNNAVEKINGDIVIYDYFLKESDNKCYSMNDTEEENKNCTKALNNKKEIDEKFVRKYGAIYKHTFKKDTDGNYYWVKSELK